MRILFIIICFMSFHAISQHEHDTIWKLDIKEIPNQRSINGSCISDEANILSDSLTSVIDSIIGMHEKATTNQLAIVIVDSIGFQDSHQFGTDLFNEWGIGQKNKDNGFLMLIIMSARRVEFVTGFGTQHLISDNDCVKIIDNSMVPLFREGKYEAGVSSGLKAVINTLEGNPPTYLKE
ncbi:TPM domain-containing protein [Paracrocinitomix mangrovi]|uniref:TPM domain-containing protein n=1 Tax=Paracrocinitomix mangrovi TaxID=2862509 RepID=UPI001C8D3D66|nr:TPM domain-containing protein [Paracrocinitomix mangrovi]UKN02920.1 TPM domain-containing protein [Paracrocinitomix mangrovi]